MAEYKEPPTVEKSLNQISWHLKTLVEQLQAINVYLKAIANKPSGSSDINF